MICVPQLSSSVSNDTIRHIGRRVCMCHSNKLCLPASTDIIQASDVSHTMQHWHIYRKWNKRLFTEMYVAFRQGRMAKDPSTFWYKGEIGFFDNYIIPLAKKLKECNVFGVSSDECLNYAIQNRNEWYVITGYMYDCLHIASQQSLTFVGPWLSQARERCSNR